MQRRVCLFLLESVVIYNMTREWVFWVIRMGRDRRACKRGFPASSGGVFVPSSLQKVFLLRLVVCCHLGAAACQPLRGIHTLLLRHEIKMITNKNKTEESRRAGRCVEAAAFRPGSCTCPSHRPLAPNTPSLSGCRCISVHKRETKRIRRHLTAK